MSEQARAPGDSRRERRRIDEVFGDMLPETTSDERDDQRERPDSDRWYHENRPPHHDR